MGRHFMDTVVRTVGDANAPGRSRLHIDVFVPYPQAGDHLAVRHPVEAGPIHNLTAENERCTTGQVRGSLGTVRIAVTGFSGSVIVQIKLLWLIGRRSCKLDC